MQNVMTMEINLINHKVQVTSKVLWETIENLLTHTLLNNASINKTYTAF